MNLAADTPRRPPIVLCASDREVLERTALAALLSMPRVAGALLEEVDRAMVVSDEALGEDVARLGSWVLYLDETTGCLSGARLVHRARHGAADELSVLTDEGAALVGLRAGQSICWPDRLGAERRLTIVSVAANLPADAAR